MDAAPASPRALSYPICLNLAGTPRGRPTSFSSPNPHGTQANLFLAYHMLAARRYGEARRYVDAAAPLGRLDNGILEVTSPYSRHFPPETIVRT